MLATFLVFCLKSVKKMTTEIQLTLSLLEQPKATNALLFPERPKAAQQTKTPCIPQSQDLLYVIILLLGKRIKQSNSANCT